MPTKAKGGPAGRRVTPPARSPTRCSTVAAVQGAGGGGRARPAARRGRAQGLGLHQAARLQNPDNRREILADAKLEPVFGKKKVTMFEMNKHLAQHLGVRPDRT